MGLSCGIVGLPNTGKTTIFHALTLTEGDDRSAYMFSTTKPVPGTVDVPDPRLDKIAEFIPPEKIIPAQMIVVDIPALVSGSSDGEGMGIGFLGSIKESDVLLHVVRCFEKAGVEHVSGALDPAVDAEIVELELAHADLQTVKRGIDRVAKRAKAGDADSKMALAAFEKAAAALENDQLLRMVEFTEPEITYLKPLFLMTMKQVLFVANVGDDDLAGKSAHVKALEEYAERTGAHVLALCGDIEAELVRMDDEERDMFMEELGIEESGLNKLIHKGFDLLGLETFFTAGPKEVRAWTIRKGTTARVGAGEIHTEFEKKFIRAEVYTFDDLMEFHSEVEIKAHGKMRIEGKDHVLHDGDICHFLIGS